MPGAGWDHLTEEEKRENGDYIQELRFDGDPRSDEEIKDEVYKRGDEEWDYMDDESAYD